MQIANKQELANTLTMINLPILTLGIAGFILASILGINMWYVYYNSKSSRYINPSVHLELPKKKLPQSTVILGYICTAVIVVTLLCR
jgi:hypothetical protein